MTNRLDSNRSSIDPIMSQPTSGTGGEDNQKIPEGRLSFAHQITGPIAPMSEKPGEQFDKVFSQESESLGRSLEKMEVMGQGSLIDRALKALGFNRKEASQQMDGSVEIEASTNATPVSSPGPSPKPEVKSAPAKLENFTNEFKDEKGNVVAIETAIRNPTVARKIHGLESKLEQMKADLASLKGIDSSTLETMDDFKILQTVVEESKLLMKEAQEQLPGLIQRRSTLQENVEEMVRNPGGVPEKFRLYKEKIERCEKYTPEQAVAEAAEKLPHTRVSEVAPALVRVSDELKSEKQKELDQLLSDPATRYGNDRKVEALRKEIDQLGKYEFPAEQLVSEKTRILEQAVEKTEIELATFKSEVEQTNATHGTTNTPRYRFQFIPHRELATKTQTELSKIAEKSSLTKLHSLLEDIGEIHGLTKPVFDGPAQGAKAFRKEVRDYLIAARDQVLPRYIEEFKVGKENGTPVLINSQLQTVGKPGGFPVSSIGRSGAISDFAHGEVSLQELKDYQNLQLLDKKGIRDDSSEAKMLMSLYDLQTGGTLDRVKLSDLVLTIKAKAILSYGGENILKEGGGESAKKNRDACSMKNLWTGDSPLRLAMGSLLKKNKLSSLSKQDYSTIKNALKTVDIDMSKLHEINDRREQNLAGLVLQDLEMHFENHKVLGEKTVYARMGLLRLDKGVKNEYGSIFNERTQGLDTMAALNFLDGKKIVFDVKEGGGSFIHLDGTIHMPEKCQAGGVKQATLSTAFLNLSVQGGNLKNSGLQEAVNDKGLKKLTELGIPEVEIKKIKEMLRGISGIAGFSMTGDVNKTVCKIIDSMNKKEFYVSANCYGGKDRTGALLALLSKFALKKTAPEAFTKREEEWKKQLTSETGVMAQVAEANAGHTVVKAQARNTALFGARERLRHYIGAAMLGLRGSAESQASGQLFKVEGSQSYKLPKITLLEECLASARRAFAILYSCQPFVSKNSS